MDLVLIMLAASAGAVISGVHCWHLGHAAALGSYDDGIRTERVRGIAQKHAARQVLSGWMPATDKLLTEVPGDVK